MATGLHRVPVFKNDLLYGILSQSDYVAFLYRHKDDPQLATGLATTIEQLGYQKGLLTTDKRENVVDVLSMMKTNGLSAIPLVNESGEIAGCFSASDFRSFPLSAWGNLYARVDRFLQARHAASLQPVYVAPASTLLDVVELMTKNKVHRVYVVDDAKKPVGVVSTTDVTRWLDFLLN